MRWRTWCLLSFVLILLLTFSAADAQPPDKREVDIRAEQVEFDQTTKMATARGKVIIVKDDVRLTSDSARYNQATKDMFAEGNVRFTRGDQEWICESLYYNFQTKALTTDASRGFQEPWYIEWQQSKDAGTNRYEATRGFITTCDYPTPHWRIQYKRLEIYPDDRVVGHDATLYIRSVPVFYWPYFRKSLDDTRMPLDIVPGISGRFGPYMYLAYEWGVTDELTITPRLDLRTQHGIGLGADADYDFGVWGAGRLRGYWAQDHDPQDRQDRLFNKNGTRIVDDFDRFNSGRGSNDVGWVNRYRVDWLHKANPTDSLELMFKAERLSDPDVVQDYAESEFRKRIQPDSFADATYTGEHYTAGILARPNLNSFFTKTERLPDAELSFVRTPLGRSGIFYEGENSVAELRREFSTTYNRRGLPVGETFSMPDYNAFRADTFHQLSYPKLLFGWLSVVPRVGGRGTYYNRNPSADPDDTMRGMFTAGAEASFKLSRVYACNNDGLDIHGLRHVVTPSVNYSYVDITHSDRPSSLFQFDTIDAFDPLSQAMPPVRKYTPRTETTRFNPVDFPAFNAIDAIDYNNVFRTGLRNQLQTKRDGRPYDLMDLWVFTDLRVDPHNDTDTDLFSFLELRPTKWLALDAESRYNFDNTDIVDVNTEVRVLKQDRWSFGLGTRYLRDDSHQATADFHYTLNENWAFRVVERVDMARGELAEQEYTLFRDLHCWTMSFTFKYRSEEVGQDNFQAWVIFSLKAFPQLHARIGQ